MLEEEEWEDVPYEDLKDKDDDTIYSVLLKSDLEHFKREAIRTLKKATVPQLVMLQKMFVTFDWDKEEKTLIKLLTDALKGVKD